MGWQDRDYAKRPTPGHVWARGRSFARRSRSIVTTLIIINVGIYVLATLVPNVGVILYSVGAMQTDKVLHAQVWRLVTAQYLHDPLSIGHLFINMLVLHFLGRPLEQMWSARRFFAIYTLCGLFGNVFYTVLGAYGVIDPRMPAVGASGSIYGLLGIVAVLFPSATVYVWFLFPLKIRTAAFIFGGIALFTIVRKGANFGGETCHLAGLVFGVWWAMKGDRWWARTEWRMPKRRASPRRPRESAFIAGVSERREDAETIDRILKKVYEGGIHSLSDREKRALQDATERQRQRDHDAGRVDRL